MSLQIAESERNKLLIWPDPPLSLYGRYTIRWESSILSVDSSKNKEKQWLFLTTSTCFDSMCWENNNYKLPFRYDIFIGSIIVCVRQACKVHVFYKIAHEYIARHMKAIEYNEIYELHWKSNFGVHTFSCAKHMLYNRLA